jgi:hypothetical protein
MKSIEGSIKLSIIGIMLNVAIIVVCLYRIFFFEFNIHIHIPLAIIISASWAFTSFLWCNIFCLIEVLRLAEISQKVLDSVKEILEGIK